MLRCIGWQSACGIKFGDMNCCGPGTAWALPYPAGLILLRCFGCCLSCGRNLGLSFLLFISITSCVGLSRMRIRDSLPIWLARMVLSFMPTAMMLRGMRPRGMSVWRRRLGSCGTDFFVSFLARMAAAHRG